MRSRGPCAIVPRLEGDIDDVGFDEFGNAVVLPHQGGAAGGAAVTAEEGATGADEAVFADVLAPAAASEALGGGGGAGASDSEDGQDDDVPAAELVAQIEVGASADAVAGCPIRGGSHGTPRSWLLADAVPATG